MKHKIIKNKRSMTGYFILMFLFRMGVLILVFSSMVIFVNNFIKNSTDIQKEEMELFVEQLFYSKHGLSYIDELTERVYPAIIDYADVKDDKKFQARLNKAFDYGKRPLIAGRFEFLFGPDIADEELLKLPVFYYNQGKFEEWNYLVGWAYKVKTQTVTKKDKIINVIIRKEAGADGMIKASFYPVKLKITLLSPNS